MPPPLLRSPRYETFDVWRGVACLAVIVYHTGYFLLMNDVAAPGLDGSARRLLVSFLSRLNLGVPLFFVISGYCILASADAHRRAGRSSFRFLARRFWRIYPPYWGAILVFLAVTLGFPALGVPELLGPPYPIALEVFRPEPLTAAQWAGNLTLTETWRPLVAGPPSFVWTRVAWSLCYEEQFYLVTFLALIVAPRHLYGVLIGVTIGSFLARLAVADVGAIHRIAGTFPILWHEFAVGLAVYGRLNVATLPRSRRLVELSLVALAAYGFLFPPSDVPVRGSTILAPLFGLVLIALRDADARASGARWLDPLRACGRRCYSLYLVHLPICTAGNVLFWEAGVRSFWARAFLVIPVVSAAAVGFGWVFHRLVERPFLNPPLGSRDRTTLAARAGPTDPGCQPRAIGLRD